MQKLCALSDVLETGGVVVQVGMDDGPRSVAVFRVENDVRAYLNICPHMGRSLDFAPGEFLFTQRGELVCPHHGACFELTDGVCTEGPCRGEALKSVAIEIVGGSVIIKG